MATNIISEAVFNPLLEDDIETLAILLYKAAQDAGIEVAGTGIADDAMKEKYRAMAASTMKLLIVLKPNVNVVRSYILKGSDPVNRSYEEYAFRTYKEMGIEKLDA